jgi:hypothetical protein
MSSDMTAALFSAPELCGDSPAADLESELLHAR